MRGANKPLVNSILSFFESGMYLLDNYLKRKATADSLPDT